MKPLFALAGAFCLTVLLAAGCSSSSGSLSPDLDQTENLPEPSIEDWHIAVGLYICGEFISPSPTVSSHPADGSIERYSQSNGVIHIYPSPVLNPDLPVTLGDFASIAGFSLDDTSLTIRDNSPAGFQQFNEAEGCGEEPASLSITRWQLEGAGKNEPDVPVIYTENFPSVPIEENLEALTISLLPIGGGFPPFPISALEMLSLDEVRGAENLPTPEQLNLIPIRPTPPPAGDTISENPTPCPDAENGSPVRVTQFSHFPDDCLNVFRSYTAVFMTNQGDIYVELDNNTYNTTNAFIVLARYLYYDGSALFRTDPTQGIIQGGAVHLNKVDDPGPGFTIADEQGQFEYGPGQLIMARNLEPNSAKGQFIFTVTEKSKRLEVTENLVVFGRVTQGIEILRKILSLHADDLSAQGDDQRFLGAPIVPVIVNKIEILEVDA